jgi:hypothetical protein
MPPKLYMETTIPSYLTARPARDLVIAGHQQMTHEWWDERKSDFDIYISQFVVDESRKGDASYSQLRLDILAEFELLNITGEVGKLASKFISNGILPSKSATDALHIAVASVHNMDFLLTWNCTHIANAEISRQIRRICGEEGYSLPVICTPEELLGKPDV